MKMLNRVRSNNQSQGTPLEKASVMDAFQLTNYFGDLRLSQILSHLLCSSVFLCNTRFYIFEPFYASYIDTCALIT